MTEYTLEHVSAMAEALTRELSDLPSRIALARKAAQDAEDAANTRRGELAAAEAAHVKQLQDLTAAHEAKCAEREHALAVREAFLVTEKREVEAERQRVSAREHEIENRAKDLSARIHGHAA
jgi:hypothetical protein